MSRKAVAIFRREKLSDESVFVLQYNNVLGSVHLGWK